MLIQTYCKPSFDTNCYIVKSEQNDELIIIDPAYKEDEFFTIVEKNITKIKLILITHRHYDHILGADLLRKKTGAPIAISVDDACGLSSAKDSLLNFVGAKDIQESITADVLLKNGQVLNYAGLNIKCISTPGHTIGGMCFAIDDVLFTGDTLFKETVGRTDLPSSSDTDMKNSLEVLSALSFDYKIYPGHGDSSTLQYEKNNNPYLIN